MKTRIILVALATNIMAVSSASALDPSLPAYQQAKFGFYQVGRLR